MREKLLITMAVTGLSLSTVACGGQLKQVKKDLEGMVAGAAATGQPCESLCDQIKAYIAGKLAE